MEYWEGKHYAFFQNTACEFFPCHKTGHPEKFSSKGTSHFLDRPLSCPVMNNHFCRH